MNKSEILNIVSSSNFTVKNTEFFLKEDPEEFFFCENDQTLTSLIVKEYFEIDYDKIISDVSKTRVILRKHNVNIWSTYFLIVYNGNLAEDEKTEVYSIERNSQGLRKYVIANETDLFRIPFINDPEVHKGELDFEKTLSEVLETDDLELKKLYKWMIEEEADYTIIDKNKMKQKINQVLKG